MGARLYPQLALVDMQGSASAPALFNGDVRLIATNFGLNHGASDVFFHRPFPTLVSR